MTRWQRTTPSEWERDLWTVYHDTLNGHRTYGTCSYRRRCAFHWPRRFRDAAPLAARRRRWHHFIGNHVNKSGDSIEWIDLIYRMVLQRAGQHDLPSGSEYCRAIRERAQQILGDGPLSRSGLWGLKLPETMLVLPLLIDAFPHAKVVHNKRHPVSSSLRRTHMTSRLDNSVGAVALRLPTVMRTAIPGRSQRIHPTCKTLTRGISK